jgi:hypothetical protein
LLIVSMYGYSIAKDIGTIDPDSTAYEEDTRFAKLEPITALTI